MATPKVYVICDQNCLYESMTKEQILAAIVQAVTEGTIGDFDTGVIQTIKTINGLPLRFFVGDQSEYNALTDEQKENLYAIITNDGTQDGMSASIKELQTNYTELHDGLVQGTFIPKTAENAKNDEDGRDIIDTYETKEARVVCKNIYNEYSEVIKTGFENKVRLLGFRDGKTLDQIVGMGLQVEFAGNATITFGYSAIKSTLAKEDSNGTRVDFAFVSPVVPTERGFTQNQINASIYLVDGNWYLCFNDGAYSQFTFNTDGALSSQCFPLSSGKFTLKSVIWWYA